MSYNVLCLTAQVINVSEKITFRGKDGKDHIKVEIEVKVPREQPVTDTYEFDIYKMTLLNRRVEDWFKSGFKTYQWLNIDFTIRAYKTKDGKAFNHFLVNSSKLAPNRLVS